MRLTKKQRASIVLEELDIHIPEPKVPLNFTSSFEALIAVLLSAQCTDARVNLTTPALFSQANTPEKMAALKPEEIEKIIRPCGLAPQKSKAIHRLSHILIEKHDSAVPSLLSELIALPGVGRKTANVILAQIFNEPAFPVDTHILRSAKRWGLSTSQNPDKVEKDLCALFPKKLWNRLHLQIILFARKYCPALRHEAKACPICSRLTSQSLLKQNHD